MPRYPKCSTPSNCNWSGLLIAEQTIAGSTAVLLGTFVLSNAGIDETFLRSLGTFSLKTDQAAGDEVQLGAIGMIVVSDQAISVGITAVPHPITDIDDDGWFVHMPIAQAFDFGDNTGFAVPARYNFDLKAKRVIHDGRSVALVVENAAAAGFVLSGVIRTLSMVRGT